MLLYFGTRAYCTRALVLTCFRLRRVVLHIFDPKQFCEFLASYGVIIQSVTQSFLKMPVCDASLTINLKFKNKIYLYVREPPLPQPFVSILNLDK